MESDRWHKIEALYNSALSLDANERAAWLTQACAGDESIKLDVLSLLESADTEDSFLEKPALSLGLTVIGLESESLIGASVDRYKILQKLGRGGMGEVYLAQDPRLNRWVALKLLPASITDDRERVRRFEQEARAASAISHPNVAHIYEIGEAEGRHYITMEYIKGPTLRHLLRKRALDPNKAVDIAIQVATALSAAHRAGVIHRDIKPENIIMAVDGYVKVLDFGLAKLIESRISDSEKETQLLSSLHTEPELFMGTSHYMSPEQVRRQPVDLRTDLWSLGVVIFEMLTLRRPFQGQSFSEVIVAIIEKEPEFVSPEQSNLSPTAQTFLGKALKKSPDNRYQTADEMLSDLRQLQQDGAQVVSAPPSDGSPRKSAAGQPPNSPRPDREPTTTAADPIRPKTLSQRFDTVVDNTVARRSVFTLARDSLASRWVKLAAAMLLVTSVGAYYKLFRKHPTTLADSAINLRFERLNLSGSISDIVLSPDGKYVASVVGEEGKDTIHITELATTSDLRVALPSEQGYSGLTFSPDGTYVYYLENQTYTGTLYRVSKLGGGQRKILNNVNTPVTFSRDGARIAFMRVHAIMEPADLIVAQADGTSERVIAKRAPADNSVFFSDMRGAGPAWSPDGKVLACATHTTTRERIESNLEVLDAQTGIGRRLNSKPWHYISGANWLADGSGLVVAGKESARSRWQLWLISYPAGEVRQVTNDPNNYTRVSATFDSGSFLTLNVEDDSNLWLVSLDGGQRFSPRVLSQRKGVSEVVWKRDGQLVYVVYDGANSNLWTEDSQGQSARQLTFESNIIRRPIITPNQRYVVFVSSRTGKPNIWRMDMDGTQSKQLTFGPVDDMPSVTADGEWVIYRTGNTVGKVSIHGGKATTLLNIAALNPVVSPDGRLLALFTNDKVDSERWHLELFDLRTLALVKRFELPQATDPTISLHWTPSGEGLTYISSANSASNLWLQPLNGAAPRQLTDFKDAEIQSFSWSPDGKQMICVRRAKAYVPLLVRLF